MADVMVKSERISDRSMSEDDDMADIARRILVKCEDAQNTGIGGEHTLSNSFSDNQNRGEHFSFEDRDNRPALQHVVFVTGCSVTFKIEITGLSYEKDNEIVDPYVHINKDEALIWLGLLGYKHDDLPQIHNKTTEVFNNSNMSKLSNYSKFSADTQATRSASGGQMANLDNHCVVPDEFTNIKQKLSFVGGISSENNDNSSAMTESESDSDKYLFKNIALEKELDEVHESPSEGTDQPYAHAVTSEPSGCDMLGDAVTMDSSLTPGCQMEIGPQNTDEHQEDQENRKNWRNGDGSAENPPNTTNQDKYDSADKQLRCAICASEYTPASGLERPGTIHTDNMPTCSAMCFKCKLYTSQTTSLAPIDLHNKKCIKVGKRGYVGKCDQCSYSTTNRRHFERHVLIHPPDKPYKCDKCDFSSRQSSSLKRHTRIHTNEKPFPCTHPGCRYRSNHSYDLTVHQRTHTGVRPYKCSWCPYAAAHPSTLRKHIRTHTKERPYKCTMCSYAARESGALSSHVRTHTNERPYRCELCPYASAHSTALRQHITAMHTK